MQLLLNEDQLANLDSNAASNSAKRNGKKPAGQAEQSDAPFRDLWNQEEGDEFFNAQTNGGGSLQELEDEGTPVPTTTHRKRGGGRGGGPGRRGRKPGPKPGRKRANAAAAEAS